MKRLLLLVGFLLTGCASEGMNRLLFGYEPSREERAQAIVNRLSTHCEAIGYQKDTEPWRQCILKLYNAAAIEQAGQNNRPSQTACQRFNNGDIICNQR